MATTKDFLEKAMLKVGSAASAINADSVIFITVDASKESNTYTPVHDGYICIYGVKNTTTSPGKVAVLNKNGITLASQIEATNWYGIDVLCPVHKGDLITIKGMEMSSMTCWLIGLIGGG